MVRQIGVTNLALRFLTSAKGYEIVVDQRATKFPTHAEGIYRARITGMSWGQFTVESLNPITDKTNEEKRS